MDGDASTFGLEWWLAWGHLRSKKREAFLSVVTWLSVIGVTVGVMALNMVLSVMTGFELDLRDKILGYNTDVVVLRYGGNISDVDQKVAEIEGVNGVVAAAPFVYTEMMVQSAWGHSGIIIKGIDPVRTGPVTELLDDLSMGPDGLLDGREAKEALFASMSNELTGQESDEHDARALPGILLGRELAEQLRVAPLDRVQVINPLGGGRGLMGLPTPTARTFRVAGIYHSGMYEYDTKWTFLANDVAQDFLDIGDTVTGIEIKVEDTDGVEGVAARIEEALGYPHYTKHWKEMNQPLFAALKMEKWVMGLILSLIVLVAGLLIVTTLILMVLTKGREIAILKAMGATRGAIMRVFIIEGAVIGLAGTVLGTIFGLLGCWALDKYEFPLDTDVYYLSHLPVVVEPTTVGVISLVAVMVCFLATLYPAYKAASVDPVEGLRYE